MNENIDKILDGMSSYLNSLTPEELDLLLFTDDDDL